MADACEVMQNVKGGDMALGDDWPARARVQALPSCATACRTTCAQGASGVRMMSTAGLCRKHRRRIRRVARKHRRALRAWCGSDGQIPRMDVGWDMTPTWRALMRAADETGRVARVAYWYCLECGRGMALPRMQVEQRARENDAKRVVRAKHWPS